MISAVFMNRVRSNQGTALIQVMVAAALISVTALVTASIATSMSDSTARANFEAETLNEMQMVKMMLADTATCTANMTAQSAVIPTRETSNLVVRLQDVDRQNNGTVRLNGDNMVKARSFRSATIYRRANTGISMLRLNFQSPNPKIPPRSREVALNTTFNNTGRIVSCSSNQMDGTGDGDVIPGNIANISGGCGDPTSGGGGFPSMGSGNSSFRVVSGRGVDGQTSTQKWEAYCRGLTFPQGKGTYQIYRNPASNNMEVIKIQTGVTAVADNPLLARGPYANLFQCINDGVNPPGAERNWTTGGGGGQDGSGSGQDYHREICIHGRWISP